MALKLSVIEIPRELGDLTSLRELYLTRGESRSVLGPTPNWDRGRLLPAELGNLINLRELHLTSFRGEIPPELGNLISLRELYIGDGLSGEIPTELGNLTNLRELDIEGIDAHGRFSGCIPDSPPSPLS